MYLTLATGTLLLSATTQAVLYPNTSPNNHTCVIDTPALSCSSAATPQNVDTCCSETYGGLVLATQFWSTYTGRESHGQLLPPAQWSLHGLWPDFCNGSYTQYCDLSRQYDPVPSPNTTTGLPNGTAVPPYTGPGVDKFIVDFGRYDLLAWMDKYWINQGAPNAEFWAHEFSKHATCFSTFDVPCYGPKYVPHQDVIDFFDTTILFYNRLPTYAWLHAASITPSNATSAKYSLSAIQAALTTGYGALPYVGCSGPRYNSTAAGNGTLDNGRTILSEVWYYGHVLGRPQEGVNYPVDANRTGSASNCAVARGALVYPTRGEGTEW